MARPRLNHQNTLNYVEPLDGGYHRASVEPRAVKRTQVKAYLKGVICPFCKASVGSKCVADTGAEKANVHISRRRIALRKFHEEQEARNGDSEN